MKPLQVRVFWRLFPLGLSCAGLVIVVARWLAPEVSTFEQTALTIALVGVLALTWSRLIAYPLRSLAGMLEQLMRGKEPRDDAAWWLAPEFGELRNLWSRTVADHRNRMAAVESLMHTKAQRLQDTERMLREAFGILQCLFENCTDGMTVIDRNGFIIACNSQVDRLLGAPVEKIAERMGARLLDALRDRFQDEAAFNTVVHQAAERPSDPCEIELRTRDATPRVVHLRSLPIPGEAGAVLGRLWIFGDRTEQHALEERMRQAQKMGAIGQLAGGIAHDFNNLLTAIRGNLALAEMTSPTQSGEARERLEGASRATDRAAELVKQLLGYSRTGDSKLKAVNVNQVLQEVRNLLRHSVDPRVVLDFNLSGDAGAVMAQAVQIEQVVLNLCINARDALKNGEGEIRVSSERVQARRPARHGESVGELREYVLVRVRDNGQGIPEPVRARIFEPFFTTKEKGKGTGLGLATAQDIIDEYDGWIEFETLEGVGTEFRVFLPRCEATSAVVGGDAPRVPAEPLREAGRQAPPVAVSASLDPVHRTSTLRGTVLVVDDEAPVRSIAVNMLRLVGHKVLEAGDGEEALRIIEERGSEIDAMVLDIYMPKLSGRETFKRLRAMGSDLPVVVCSGFVVDPDEFVALGEGKEGPVDVIQKPYSVASLSRSVAKAVQAKHRGGLSAPTAPSDRQLLTAGPL